VPREGKNVERRGKGSDKSRGGGKVHKKTPTQDYKEQTKIAGRSRGGEAKRGAA